jgi:hypothetical protein
MAGWGYGSRTETGFYLKDCCYCGEKIVMLKSDYDGRWRPFESWVAGNCAEGEWVIHRCAERTGAA